MGEAREPRFSPGGRELAWTARVDGFWQIRIRSMGTGRIRTLLTSSFRPHGLSWSPGGDRLAWTQALPDAGGVPAAGDRPETLWIRVIPVAGGRARRLGPADLRPRRRFDGAPLAWTPDGRALIVPAVAGGRGGDASPDLYEVTVATGYARLLLSRDGVEAEPAVSPDGRLVAFTAGGPDRPGAFRLHTLERAGSPRSLPVATGETGSVSRPAWEPSGRALFGVVDRRGLRRLALFELDGIVRFITDPLDPAGPGGPEGGYGLSGAGGATRFVVSLSGPDRPGELFLGRPDGTSRRLTSIHRHLDPGRLGRAIAVAAETGTSGRAADAPVIALLPPRREDPSSDSPWPVVVRRWPPGERPPPTFDLEAHLLASGGAAVLSVPGRGLADDTRVARWVGELPNIDPERIVYVDHHPAERPSTPGGLLERARRTLARLAEPETGGGS